jgi:5-carboxymethyl-2-hydroxymuconate isomerase
MPHFIIEYGNALHSDADRHDAMQIAADCGATFGFMNPGDIKVRLIPVTDFLMLDGRKSFVHISVRLLDGRSVTQKKALSDALCDALDARYSHVESVSVDVVDMNAATYRKRLA